MHQLLDAGASMWDGRRQSAVEVALLLEDEELLTLLMAKAGKTTDDYRASLTRLFRKVAYEGDLVAVEMLIKYVLRVDADNKPINQGLIQAAESGQLDVVRLLLRYEADDLNTALVRAARRGHFASGTATVAARGLTLIR